MPTSVPRPSDGHPLDELGDVDDAVSLLAPWPPTVTIEVPIRAPDDAPVVAAALAGAAEAIVTGDRGLLEDDALRRWLAQRGVRVLTPVELLAELSSR